jgi:hypothetical protein
MKKRKPAKNKELEASWAALKAQFENLPPMAGKFVRTKPKQSIADTTLVLPRSELRADAVAVTLLKSRATAGGSTAAKCSPQYTGSAMLGVAVMHKSNAVPVFTEQDAQDIAKMRRN